jgi:hypothetical protein
MLPRPVLDRVRPALAPQQPQLLTLRAHLKNSVIQNDLIESRRREAIAGAPPDNSDSARSSVGPLCLLKLSAQLIKPT